MMDCAARKQGTAGGNYPADCDWPHCGCDPHADKVMAALQEEGYPTPTEARAFVDFVLRHTWPERATAHGAETVHSIIKHHPFAKSHGTTPAIQDEAKQP
jgi:hypothetical protein